MSIQEQEIIINKFWQTETQRYVNGFWWERIEHGRGIYWNRLSEDIELQGMGYVFYRDCGSWYYHANSKVKAEKVKIPNIELLHQNLLSFKNL